MHIYCDVAILDRLFMHAHVHMREEFLDRM